MDPCKITILGNVGFVDSVLGSVSTIGGCPLSSTSDDKKTIRYRTVEEFKGLESDVVILVNHSYVNEPQTELKRAMLYTAMTRARFYLYVIDYERDL